MAQVWDLTDAAVAEGVFFFWQYCKYVQSTTPDAVWVNFDETPLWFAMFARQTHVARYRLRFKQPVRLVGNPSLSRARITVGLSISTDPDFARVIPVFVIMRSARKTKLDNRTPEEEDRRPTSAEWADVEVPEGLEVHWQRNAWMNEHLIGEWVGLLTQARDRMYGPGRVVVLVRDSFKAHLTEAVRILCAANNIRIIVIPSGLTSLLQGLDTHINKSFKASRRSRWRRILSDAADPCAGALGMHGFLHLIQGAAADSLRLVASGRQLAGLYSGCASFLQNGLANDLDGSEDGLINIRHRAVVSGRRAGLPCLEPRPRGVGAIEQAQVAVADAGYGSEWSDGDAVIAGAAIEDGEDSGEERAAMRSIVVARNVWVAGVRAASDASDSAPVTGFVGLPGQRRSTRVVKAALPKQDQCTGGGRDSGGSGGAHGGGLARSSTG